MDKLAIWLTGLLMVVIAILGLRMAAAADDVGMVIFGSGLCLFGLLFVFGLLKIFADRYYDGRQS